MSKKTRYALGRIAAAVGLIATSSIASAANCSTSYCFVGGVMTWSSSQDLESVNDLLGISISALSGSTTTVLNGAVGDQGYVTRIASSPVTKVSYSQPNRIGTAWLEGSGIIFTRTIRPQNKIVTMKDMQVKLQSAPGIASIDSVLQGTKIPTLWNLNGDGTQAIGIVAGNGAIAPTLESDGYYHARITVSSTSLVGSSLNLSQTNPPPYATGALNVFWAGLGITSAVWFSTLDSTPFGLIELDMRFSKQ